MSSQFAASSHCLLQMFSCKFIILFNDSGAQRNLKITYNDNLPHYRDFLQSQKYPAEQQSRLVYASSKMFLFSCHFKTDYRRIHHDKIAYLIEYFIQR